tara:strand:- start:1592 stop:3073 length:1482 start_codon:yes stop_codon:yes gene_type:complete
MNDIRKQINHRLCSLGKGIQNTHISDLLNKDCEKRVIQNDLLNFDYSKQRINDQIIDYLLQIPDLIDLDDSLRLLFNGEAYNPSEDRLVSHTIYRNKNFTENFELIFKERERIKSFLDKNTANLNFKNLICLGIGGSRLGPELLNEFQSLGGHVNIYFCSSYDLLELGDVLRNCNQSETIIFASSKSFETSEILKNLDYVKSWYGKNSDVGFYDHLYGISANALAMTAYGIKKSNQFHILDSLVGRFSIWSSVSLPAFINSNFDSYLDLLEGARLADEHTRNSSWESNIPVIMALLSVWNTSSLNINNHGIFTYNFRLRSLTKYISQLSMESNGKSINSELEESPFLTSPLIWGGYGIESQHSTFQWLMQGKTETSCDFIGLNCKEIDTLDSHEMLLAQVLALTHGKEDKDNPFKSIRGNNPCSILQLNSINLKSLGFLLAIYEHKVFIEASILGIDPFDQWGVQLGKELALEAKSDLKFLKDNFSLSLQPKS